MNFKRLLLFLAAPLALVMGSCTPEGPEYTIPSITITDAEGKEVTAIGFAAENPENTALPQEYVVTIKSTRSWSITKEADWLGVTPADFSNTTQLEQTQEVKFTAVANEEGPRSQTVKVTMDKITKEIVVSQAGAGQTALGDVLFYDNFDKKVAEKDGNYWPYMSAEYGNPTPENQSDVTYASKNVTVRANSNSDGSYSDYAGSGSNNIFFGKTPTYLTISGISLAELEGNALTMTFGSEKYSEDNGSTFTESEFHVYLSADGEKWTEIDYTFAGTADGRWNLATAQFNLKEVPESVSIAFIIDVASSYRLDDLKLTEGGGGAEIDLSQGSELDFESGSGSTGGGDQGGETTAPENALLWASFATDMANFTIENVELGGLDYVWYHDAEYKQMKASAFKDNVRYVTESYLVSPVVALTGAEDYYMNFEHTGKYFGNMSEQATLWVREEGGAWAQLTIPTYMTGDNWTFVKSGDIALTAYAGKNIQIGFRYTSTATDAPTWEVKNVLVAKGTASETPETPETPNVPLESIDATSDAAFVCSTDDSANAAYGLGESTANGASATGFKLGKSRQEGKFTSAAVGVSGDKYLNFFAVSWGAGGDKTIYFRVNGGEVKSQAIRANDGAKGNAPYTMSVYANDHYSVLLSGLKETDVIEFGTNADFALTGGYAGSGNDYAPRVIFFGVKLTDEPVSGEGGGNTEPEDPEDPEDPETPVEPTVATIASILALGQDATVAEGTFVEGVVISNSELNNLTSKKGLYIQDETAGLQFYCGANHSFKFGDKVKVDLSGQKIGAYNGAVQISGTALDKFEVISSDNAVEAKAVTMADFLANKYEGQYIALEGVQVVADDLAKTWGDETQKSHISINMEDAEGNNFVVFSSRYATYAAETVAQGSGTIKGISSINVKDGVTTMQIIFAQATDYAGLTGERFGATIEPEDPEQPEELAGTGEGTLESPYDVVRAKAAIDAYTTVSGVYVKGVVTTSEIKFNSTYSSCDYYISVDGTTDNELMVYSGKFVDGANFTSADQIHAGDEVVVCGDLKKHYEIYEFNYSSTIVSLTCNHETPEEPEDPETPVTGAIALPWMESFDSADLSKYTVVNGGTETKVYPDDKLAGGEAGEILISKNNGSLTATIASDGSARTLNFWFKTNKADQVTVSSATSGVTINKISSVGYTVELAAGVEVFALTLTNTQSSNIRVDDIVLTADAPAIESISVSGAQMLFAEGDEFTTGDNFIVTALLQNGVTEDVTAGATVDSSAVDMTTAGSYTVTVSYNNITTTYNVSVQTAGAETVTTSFVFKSLGYANGDEVKSVTGDGVTIDFALGTNSNGNTAKYYTTGEGVRTYVGNTITVSCDYNINSIEFKFAGDTYNKISCDGYSGTTWSGNAKEVVFDSTATTRIQSITVTYVK